MAKKCKTPHRIFKDCVPHTLTHISTIWKPLECKVIVGKVRPWLGWHLVTPCQGHDLQNPAPLEAMFVNWLIVPSIILTFSILTQKIAFQLDQIDTHLMVKFVTSVVGATWSTNMQHIALPEAQKDPKLQISHPPYKGSKTWVSQIIENLAIKWCHLKWEGVKQAHKAR